jgi:hypothetical protein
VAAPKGELKIELTVREIANSDFKNKISASRTEFSVDVFPICRKPSIASIQLFKHRKLLPAGAQSQRVKHPPNLRIPGFAR